MNLGPTGYPFEKYIAKVLNTYNFTTKTNQVLNGKCVFHEVDVWRIKIMIFILLSVNTTILVGVNLILRFLFTFIQDFGFKS